MDGRSSGRLFMTEKKKSGFFRNNGLSLVMAAFMLFSLFGQAFTGWHKNNETRTDFGEAPLSFLQYLHTGHFISATFENWESEFLQMCLYVMLTVFLYQKGSSESKDPDKPGGEAVDREPVPRPDAPWPVRRGGFWLKLYQHSLSLAFALLFFISFSLHFAGSLREQHADDLRKGKPLTPATEYFTSSEFWFESFQNWQSEFLSVLSIVLLSIWLRQKGSPESKPVDAPYGETGG